VDIARLFAHGRGQPGSRLVLVTWCCGLILVVQASHAAQLPTVRHGSAPRGPPVTGVHRPRDGAAEIVSDVSIRPDGVLRGRVVGARLAGEPAALRVKLLRDGQTVALTATGPRGEFALRNLSGGLYQVVVGGSGAPKWPLYRVWTSSAAPPQARREMNVPIGDLALRGQRPSPFPIMSLPQAATVAGIAAGAIAAPVIYHNALMDNRVPQSP
jgi:hypothetical protein